MCVHKTLYDLIMFWDIILNMNYLIKVYKHAHSTYTFLIIINPTKKNLGKYSTYKVANKQAHFTLNYTKDENQAQWKEISLKRALLAFPFSNILSFIKRPTCSFKIYVKFIRCRWNKYLLTYVLQEPLYIEVHVNHSSYPVIIEKVNEYFHTVIPYKFKTEILDF